MTVGGVNSTYFNGTIEYVPLCNASDNAWAIDLSDIVINGVATGLSVPCTIIDT